jgi:hypothetical protein
VSLSPTSEPQEEAVSTVKIVPPSPGWRAAVLTLGLVAVVLAVAVHLAGVLIRTQNQNLGPRTDPDTGEVRGDQDQKHNVNRALLARQYWERDPSIGLLQNVTRWWPHDTDGIVNPLWPWVASRLAEEGHPYDELEAGDADRRLFEKGKWFNVGLVLVAAGVLGVVLARKFRPAAAVAVLLLGVFGALLPRAVYFQPEPLYYVFLFLAWLCALRLLLGNPVGLHALFGVLAGLAWLAKTSSEVVVLAWFGAATWRWLCALCCRGGDAAEESRWSARRHFLGLVAFAIGWLAVCGPRYTFAAERFGSRTHTWPGVWMWMDDFGAGVRWMQAHPDRASLEAVPETERPSLALYRKTHSDARIWERLTDGYWEKWSKFLAPRTVRPSKQRPFSGWRHILPSRGLYLGGLLAVMLLAGAFVWVGRRRADREALRLPCGAGAAAMFVMASCLGYGLVYGWYTPIGRGDRFMLSLYLPLAFSFAWAGESMMNLVKMRGGNRWMERVYGGLLWTLNAAVAWRLVEVLRLPVFDPVTQ